MTDTPEDGKRPLRGLVLDPGSILLGPVGTITLAEFVRQTAELCGYRLSDRMLANMAAGGHCHIRVVPNGNGLMLEIHDA